MNGHDFTLEQNTEARMMLAVARRGLAAAINDAENGIGHLSCDDPKIMEQVRAHWRRLYDTYMNADALLSDLESCALDFLPTAKAGGFLSRMRHVPHWRGLPVRVAGVGVSPELSCGT